MGYPQWYWMLPPAYRGNLSAAYGRTLTFDLNQDKFNLGCLRGNKAVRIDGNGFGIYQDAPYKPRMAWTHYSFQLDETAPWFDIATNQRVTKAEFQAVLANVGQIKILCGWLLNCDEGTAGLDNVVLNLADNQPAATALPVAEGFENGAAGWAVAGGTLGLSGPIAPHAAGGSFGGYVAATGYGGGGWFWIAPPRFLGNLSSAYGQTLRFDLIQDKSNLGCQGLYEMVILDGGGYEIYYKAPFKVQTSWTNYGVLLDASATWYHIADDTRVNEAELRAVLSALGQLKIRGGWLGNCGEGTSGLDEVVLGDN